MRDIHPLYSVFRDRFPEVARKCAEAGEEIHERSGPISSQVRILIKVAVSAAVGHQKALETQLARAREAGVSAEEVLHALLLLIPTCGFPRFMEAFQTFEESESG